MAKKHPGSLYEQDNESKDKYEYEVRVLPLQNYVVSVRKSLCSTWGKIKVRVVEVIY
jgi:hypothetical protein